MLPFKNVGIFGEAEERHEKMIKRLSAVSSLMTLLDTVAEYPDQSNPREQVLIEEMFKIVLEKFEGLDEEVDGD